MFTCPKCDTRTETVEIDYYDVHVTFKGDLTAIGVEERHDSENWKLCDGPFYTCPNCSDDITEAILAWDEAQTLIS